MGRIIKQKEFALFLFLLVFYSYFIHWEGWNEDSRLDLTKAIVEEGSFEINSYYNNTGDRSVINGNYYSDKAPGASFVAVAPYAVWKTIWKILPDFLTKKLIPKEQEIENSHGVEVYNVVNPGAFELFAQIIVTILVSSLPGALAVLMIYRIINEEHGEKKALISSFALGIGTPFFYSSTVFLGTALASFLSVLAFYLLHKKKSLLSGLLLGLAITTEYSTIAIALVLFLRVINNRKKAAGLLALGLLLGVSPLLFYNTFTTGSPLTLTRGFIDENIFIDANEKNENYGISGLPNVFIILRLLFYPERGLFIYAPILMIAVYGLLLQFKTERKAIFPIAILLFYVLAISTYHSWDGGYSFSSRHLIPMIPFLILGLPSAIGKIKMRYVLPILLLSILINLTSTHLLIDDLTDLNTHFLAENVAKIQNSFKVISNPILTHYFPNFFKIGPRSRIFENLINGKLIIDIREKPISHGLKFPFDSLFVPFLSMVPMILLMVVLFWSETKNLFIKLVRASGKLFKTSEFKIFLTFFIFYIYFAHWPGWNEYSSFALTSAIVDEKRVEIDNYINYTGDRAFFGGHYYTTKPTGLSLLSVPPYATLKVMYGAFNKNSNFFEDDFYHSLQKILATSISSFFGALSVLLVYLICGKEGLNTKKKVLITAGYGLGTIILSQSTIYSRHLVSASLLLLAYYILNHSKKTNYLLSGVIAGFAGTVDYPSILISGLLIIHTGIKRKHLPVLLVLGIIIGGAPTLIYNNYVFGSFLEFANKHVDTTIFHDNNPEIDKNLGFQSVIPNVFIMIRLLIFPERGLLIYSPLLLLSIINLPKMWKKRRNDALLCFMGLFLLLIVFSQYEEWGGGYTFGPRFLVPAIPFLILPLILLKNHKERTLQIIVVISILVNLLSLQVFDDSLTDPLTLHLKSEYREKENSISMIANPIIEQYIPVFLAQGPRSRILESLYNKEGYFKMDDWYDENIHPIIVIMPILIIVILIWRAKIKEIIGLLLF